MILEIKTNTNGLHLSYISVKKRILFICRIRHSV